MAVSFFKTLDSFAKFLWNFVATGGGLVDQNTANLRAATCAACHNNKPSTETRGGCSSCNKGANKALDAIRDTIIKSNKTPYDAKLKSCMLCGCDLRISVWIPNQVLLKLEDANAYPSFCWKKKIQENLEV